MDISFVKQFLASCHNVKRIAELMPELPAGMTPRHIHVIDAVFELGRREELVRVSDISEYFNVTRPSITKLIHELENMGVVEKKPDSADKRVVLLRLTELGQEYYDFYITKYHTWVAEQLAGIDPQELCITANVINQVYGILSTRKMEENENEGNREKN